MKTNQMALMALVFTLLLHSCDKDNSETMLTVSPSAYTFSSANGSHNFEVNASQSWTLSEDCSWLSVTPSAGVGGATLVAVTVEENTAASARNYSIVFSPDNGGSPVSLIIHQNAVSNSFTVSPASKVFTAHSANFTLNINSTQNWTATENVDWLAVSPFNGDDASTVLYIEANNTTVERSTIITFTSSGFPDATVTITQAAGEIFSIPIPAAFLTVAGKLKSYTDYANYKGTRVYQVYTSPAKTVRLAEICLEYLKGYHSSIPAVVVYPYLANDLRSDFGYVVSNKALVDWSNTTRAYRGSAYNNIAEATYEAFYYNFSTKGFFTATTAPAGTKTPSDAVAYEFQDAHKTALGAVAPHTYPVVKIGKQYWIGKNLYTLNYFNETPITTNQASIAWSSAATEMCCVYNNYDARAAEADANSNYNVYGVLYNWDAAQNLDHGVWKLPTQGQRDALKTYVMETANGGGDAGLQLKTGNNVTGFDGLYAGFYSGGLFSNEGMMGRWWTSTSKDASNAWIYGVSQEYNVFSVTSVPNNTGLSVRLVRESL